MAEQPYAIDAGHPPSALLKLVNPVLSLLLRTPLAGPARKQLMVLNFTGRKTGRPFTVPVSAHVIDNQLYALTGAAWKQNFRGGAPARVSYDGNTTAMRGELIRDPAIVSDLYHRCAESYGVRRAQTMIGLKFRDRRIPTAEEFGEAVDRMHLAAIRLTPVA
ncbi:hypothetical protein [Mycobacterium sherrisii]|uniref:Deazaflavin-dependent nitroreductase n=1 Tax=Mycobacterium sherrisii TaxID=243061 RepID=A0A1E3T197_9MYCO|nr:hypothetical protein [Mycobacterium sherrisii]MCV7028576.1 hypothetical protein [Mycobacterium sherrisii]MEC4764569.1 hypothetical protein [Mycobacterium sherrisii]ODR08179.1 hypothetical protein BHQ21_07100 [Mycobacterium sherrisii]ORW78933.1 hypothetical protein AWC25_05210 [Mycobacterium sherrisii]